MVFDLFGTLVEGWGQRAAARNGDEIASLLGVPQSEFRALLARTYSERASGQLGSPPEMLRRLAGSLGFAPGEAVVQRAATRRVAQFREVLREPRPGVGSLLAVLRDRRFRVGVITDCSGETPALWPQLYWTAPIQAAVFSWSEGVRKPDGRLYRKAAGELGLDPAECLYVGDGGSAELSGASRAGMRACQLLAPRGDGDQLLQYDPDPSWSGPVVGSLCAILPLLRA